ncbi:putative sodium-dependent multivitamin transporter [Flavobacteriaceae bacterium UJ101]|nr:putative sodium-dependent multivitamin transporter [Flavobacteriaceae bacterium UJ101]
MSATEIVILIIGYFIALISISFFTGKSDDNDAFFTGKKESPWYIVAFGMIGASLSGVTFISVPGAVEAKSFSYMQVVLGYFFGYLVISFVLLPLYYRLNLTSIYGYLKGRFGFFSYKTGAVAFLISRTIGAAFRLFLVANVLQWLIFDQYNVPYWLTVTLTIVLIWVYTFRAGIKTIIWTDTLQTLFMLIAVGVTIYFVSGALQLNSFSAISESVLQSEMSQIFFFDDANDGKFFLKNFLAGIFITITMTGLDQDMMQKNLSCKNVKEAQKNMLSFSVVLIFVNLVFLVLGLLLTQYAQQHGLDFHKDKLFPMIAMLPELGKVTSAFFILGLIAAAYSSADSALTSLTTSFSVDILEIETKENAKRLRKIVHVGFSILLIFIILLFKEAFKDESVIWELFKAAGYTYGPLLGMYAFGLFTKWNIKDRWVPLVAFFAPVISYLIKYFADQNGHEIGFEILIYNGLIMFLGLLLIRDNKKTGSIV